MKRLAFVDPADAAAAITAATETVGNDGVLLLPTETYYGLGASPFSRAAVERVYSLKGRPETMPLSVLVADWQQLEDLVEVPRGHRIRLSRTWPGPLTAILPARRPLAAAAAGTVAVRIPGHAMLRSLLYRTGPLTGTSANRHGRPPCVDPDEALASLVGAPDLVLDGQTTAGGAASTLVDLCGSEPEIIRQGGLEWDDFYAQFLASQGPEKQ